MFEAVCGVLLGFSGFVFEVVFTVVGVLTALVLFSFAVAFVLHAFGLI